MEKEWMKQEAKTGSTAISDQELLAKAQFTQFTQQHMDKGRDYCYFYHNTVQFEKEWLEDYCLMVYSLNEPQTLESAAKRDFVLSEDEQLIIHRVAVIRNGKLVDKLPDTQIKMLDNEHQSGQGFFTNNKTINMTIKDLRLHDTFIFETTIKNTYKEDSIQRDYCKYVYQVPSPYWAYGEYRTEIINRTGKEMVYKSCFFRDEQDNVRLDEGTSLPDRETFVFERKNYFTDYDASTEIAPFINFATKATYEELASYLYKKHYQEFDETKWHLPEFVPEFAPELVENLAAESTLAAKIRYAIEFVQNSIYYLYDAEAMDGHKPQSPAKTYETRQGDCKAKTVLLKTILDYLQVDASIILVNYRADYFLKHYLPSISNFNHAILKITYEGKEPFVDATLRDDYGLLENRTPLELMYYLEVQPEADLSFRSPFFFDKYCAEEKTTCTVENNTATVEMNLLLRYRNANNIRRMFKVEDQKDILTRYNQFMWNALCLSNKYSEAEISQYFEKASVQLVADDQNLNEVQMRYQVTIKEPYTYDTLGKAYLQYWDRGFLDDAAREFVHKDFPYWLSSRRLKSEIELFTDQKIDVKEKYTNQECHVQNDYWHYQTKKKVTKNGATVSIESNPLFNAALEKPAFAEYLKAEQIIRDSNWGLGIDIVKPGLLARLFGR